MSTQIEIKEATIFQGNMPVLHRVNLEVKSGEFVYLVGRTGSGKSSLLKMLYGDLILTEGEASIAGFNLNGMKKKEIPYLRRKLGIVFQDFQLLTDRSVYKNLWFAMRATGWKDKSAMRQNAFDVLEKVNIKHKDYKIPGELSGGEQQRVVVARALINNPDIILADEPTGNLDPEVTDEVMELLHSLSKEGKTVVMATHDYRVIEKFKGRVITVADGKVFEKSEAASAETSQA
jgi:cell division transport system ATP-binding protein